MTWKPEGEPADYDGYANYHGEYHGDGQGDDDDDAGTVIGRGEGPLKRVLVTIQQSKRTRRLQFVDFKGNTRYTSRREWQKVDGGYELVWSLDARVKDGSGASKASTRVRALDLRVPFGGEAPSGGGWLDRCDDGLSEGVGPGRRG